MRTRRDEEAKEKWMALCASLELYRTWSELCFLSGKRFPFTFRERTPKRAGAVHLLGPIP